MSRQPRTLPLFDEDGALSQAYLLHRGYCCENGCRNCPYGFRKRNSASGASLRPSPVAGPPRRIVSLCPSNTELTHALGLLPRLVGVDDWSDWPEGIASLPRVGPDLAVDMARVAALRPDLVLASLSVPGMERNVTQLREWGLPHLTLDPHRIADVWENLREVGRAAGVSQRAEAVVEGLQDRVRRVEAITKRVSKRPRIYWEWWPKPLFAPGGRNWLTELSRLAGAESVTAGTDADCARPHPDEIREADPDWILLAWTGVARDKVRPEVLRRRSGWSELRAMREGRVLVLEEGMYCRPSPRLIDGLEALAARLHPELFPVRGKDA